MSRTRFLAAAAALMAVLTAAGAAEEGNVYYSVQFAVLKDLAAVNRQVNALQTKEKLVFWEQTTVPGAGSFYRVYLGRFPRWEDALAFAEHLKEAGELERYGIHWFSEPKAERIEPPPELRGRVRLYPLKTLLPPVEERFVNHRNGTITDAATGLMWPQNGWRFELLSAMPWNDAVEKVSQFELAGHSDWRLPTIEEWLSLIDSENRNPALVSPNPFVNIISHMPYWSATEYTYGRDRTCLKECPLESYTVMLYTGSVNHQKKTDLAFVMPVRSAARP